MLSLIGGSSLVGFEDLADEWKNDSDLAFVGKLLAGCLVGSYVVKYVGIVVQPPVDALPPLAIAMIVMPSLLNALKWKTRSEGGVFEGPL